MRGEGGGRGRWGTESGIHLALICCSKGYDLELSIAVLLSKLSAAYLPGKFSR